MNILLLGGSGFIGSKLRESLSTSNHIYSPSHSELDVTDVDSLTRTLDDRKFDCVVNCIGIVGKDLEISELYAVNTIPSKIISNYNLYYVFISSAAVYDTGIHDINSIPSSIIPYGFTKINAENNIMQTSNNYLIIRYPSIYGNSPKSMLYRVIDSARRGDAIYGTNKITNPIFLDDAISTTSTLINSIETGIYHIAASNYCRYYELIHYALEVFNIRADVEVRITEEYGSVILPNIPMPKWEESINNYYREVSI